MLQVCSMALKFQYFSHRPKPLLTRLVYEIVVFSFGIRRISFGIILFTRSPFVFNVKIIGKNRN
jgi:hypothetical protein